MAPTLRQRKADHTAVVASEQNTPVASPAATKAKKLPVRSRAGGKGAAAKKSKKKEDISKEDGSEEDEVEVSQLSQASPAPAKNTKMTFDDEDDFVAANATPIVEAPKKKAVVEEEEEESSDDEAPEAVSMSTAAAEVLKAASVQQKAAQQKAAAEKKKRQDRDAKLKQQATERKKEAEEKKAADAKAQAEESSEGADEETPAVVEKNITILDQPSKSNKRSIPTLLPEEFLNSDSEDGDLSDDEEDAAGKPRAKKRKIARVEKDLAKQSRGPKDEVLGSTVYRIAKEVDTRLAPKKSNHASGMKNALLKRGRQPVKTGKGFFKK